jgi:hypothetical protein
MARSITLQSNSFGRDPLAELEHSRAEAAGKKLSKREKLEMGNRPLSDSGRRTPDEGPAIIEPAPRKALEDFFAEESQPRQWSEARKAIEALFK